MVFAVFCQFFGPTFKCNFLCHLFMLFCEVVGAQRAPNEGPKGPPMPSAGARRKGPQGPELLVFYIFMNLYTELTICVTLILVKFSTTWDKFSVAAGFAFFMSWLLEILLSETKKRHGPVNNNNITVVCGQPLLQLQV